jgi:Holliday junction resolvase RusA-like endonuclease|tara:strand:- start:1739 stop:2260 length:522 start_codon:yes stop_codon:yes gene_type:complete
MGEWTYMVEVPGDPIGKGRPRGTSIGGKVRLYTPKKTSDWERSAAMIMTSVWRKAPVDEPVEVEIAAFSHRPKRLLRRKDPDHVIWKGSKPDADNICKCALDALVMAGVLRDDSLAVKVTIQDFYAERDRGPRLCLRMRSVGPEPVEGWWDTASHRTASAVARFTLEEGDLPW